jgi:homoserine dehydrogenase
MYVAKICLVIKPRLKGNSKMLIQKSIAPRILFIGFGKVGQKIAELFISKKETHPGLSDLNPKVIGIFTRTHGAVVNQDGINLENAFNMFVKSNHFKQSSPDYVNIPVIEAVQTLDYDCLIGVSGLAIKEHGEPAVSYTREALKRHINVVSANKGPAAFAYTELHSLADRQNVKYLHESAVMDGAPVFNLYRNNLRGCKVTGLSGILNSTTNFILSKMEDGETFQKSLKEAQKFGFVVYDYLHDINGWDAAVKITVLANELMAANLTPEDVLREGIGDITIEQVQNACDRGYHLKLVCRAFYERGSLLTRVSVEEVPDDHIFSNVSGSGSILRIETDLMNPIMIVQENPSIVDTAYGIISDLLSIFYCEAHL